MFKHRSKSDPRAKWIFIILGMFFLGNASSNAYLSYKLTTKGVLVEGTIIGYSTRIHDNKTTYSPTVEYATTEETNKDLKFSQLNE